MKDKNDIEKNILKDKWKRIFLFTVAAILTYFIIMTVVTPKRYKFIEGDIASVDIKAPRDIIDERQNQESTGWSQELWQTAHREWD